MKDMTPKAGRSSGVLGLSLIGLPELGAAVSGLQCSARLYLAKSSDLADKRLSVVGTRLRAGQRSRCLASLWHLVYFRVRAGLQRGRARVESRILRPLREGEA